MDDPLDHAIDWLLGLVTAAIIAVAGAIMKVWRHEERIKALEAHHNNHDDTLKALSDKVDHNHNSLTDRLAEATEDIRADIRVLTNRLLNGGS